MRCMEGWGGFLATRRPPKPELDMRGCRPEVVVSGQDLEVVSSAQLNQQGVNSAYLDVVSSAGISNLGSVDIVLSIWLYECKRRETFYDAVARLGARKALQQFLQYKTGAEDLIGSEERIAQCNDLWRLKFSVSAKGQ
jgi:hypothetical protein